jgi:hypothetical protein
MVMSITKSIGKRGDGAVRDVSGATEPKICVLDGGHLNDQTAPALSDVLGYESWSDEVESVHAA